MTLTLHAPPPIVIAGAGPGGLLLANLLQRHGLAVVVYDAEAGPSARNQGGTLDLHAETGLAALEEAGLLDAVMARARSGEAEAMKIMTGAGEVVFDENEKENEQEKEEGKGGEGSGGGGEGEGRGRPEIDR